MFTQIYFFQFDEGGQRWHDKKLFKSRARLDIRKYTFSNRIVGKWNYLSENIVNCNTVNTFKKCIATELEPETSCLSDVRQWALNGESLCLLMPSMSTSLALVASVNSFKSYKGGPTISKLGHVTQATPT